MKVCCPSALWTSALLIGLCLFQVEIGFGQEADEVLFRARTVLQLNCQKCHQGEGSEGGNFDVLDVKSLVDEGLVEPGDPDNSTLLQKMIREEMPPGPQLLSIGEGESIRRWIASGAQVFPTQIETRQFIPIEQIVLEIRNYLRDADHEDTPYLRFFTLHHLHNDSRILSRDLALFRAAFSKMTNSLSWKSRIVIPKAINDSATLFVIDLRSYDWDRTQAWRYLTAEYPYGLRYANSDNYRLQQYDQEIINQCEETIYLLRVDWFIANASRAPLYDEILGIPEYGYELERMLKVDIRENFLEPTPERIARAGFVRSGVSEQNRLVERHDALHGYLWKSYDFGPRSRRGNLTRFPLGPASFFTGRNPYQNQGFVHDGGEIIFSLPNGLQGYMLVDGKDRKIQKGPIAVVSDALKTSGNNEIVNGLP